MIGKNLGKKSHKRRSVERIDILTGEVKEYESILSTEKDGFISSHVSSCCSGKRKKHKGYYWSFLKEVIYEQE